MIRRQRLLRLAGVVLQAQETNAVRLAGVAFPTVSLHTLANPKPKPCQSSRRLHWGSNSLLESRERSVSEGGLSKLAEGCGFGLRGAGRAFSTSEGGSARWEREQKRREASRAEEERRPGRNELAQQEANEIQPAETHASDLQVASVVNHPALIITRAIEWGTVLLGFEQANKYTVLDQDGNPVALIAEDITGIGNAVGRQLLKTRRSLTATVFSADGSQIIFRIRRPMYLISSTMYVEDGEGEVIGSIHQRWHLYRRNYDMYLGNKQFAEIGGNFLAWEFELKDSTGGTLALIDRNFQGFGKELFTDAGKYVIHFGQPPEVAAKQVTETLAARTKNPDLPAVTPVGKLRTGVEVIPTFTGNQLVVARPLQLSERMLALACAMTIDFDYFSQHSHSGGFFAPPIFLPIGGMGGGDEAAGAAAGATAAEGAPGAEGAEGSSFEGGDDSPGDSNEGEWLDSGEGDDGGFFGGGGGDSDGGTGFWGGISDMLSDN
ncbi:hypothetical protein BSKO_11343 [Bryopsis sp. KO-2023]|nr:hypothetical protein BSKO_11343 [Bryopsis sp. KO-2023]